MLVNSHAPRPPTSRCTESVLSCGWIPYIALSSLNSRLSLSLSLASALLGPSPESLQPQSKSHPYPRNSALTPCVYNFTLELYNNKPLSLPCWRCGWRPQTTLTPSLSSLQFFSFQVKIGFCFIESEIEGRIFCFQTDPFAGSLGSMFHFCCPGARLSPD
jgi:hypothetical protein